MLWDSSYTSWKKTIRDLLPRFIIVHKIWWLYCLYFPSWSLSILLLDETYTHADKHVISRNVFTPSKNTRAAEFLAVRIQRLYRSLARINAQLKPITCLFTVSPTASYLQTYYYRCNNIHWNIIYQIKCNSYTRVMFEGTYVENVLFSCIDYV